MSDIVNNVSAVSAKAPQQNMLKKYRNQIIFGLIGALAIYVVILLIADNQLRLETDGIGETLARFNVLMLLPLIGLQLVVMFFRWVEWHYYLGVVGARQKLSLLDSVLIQIAGFVLVVSPGKAGELLKAVPVKAKTGIPIARVAPVILAERIIDGMAVIVILTVTLLLAGDNLNLGTYNGIDYDLISRTIIFSSAALLAGGMIVVQIEPLARFCLNLLKHVPVLNRLYNSLTLFYASSKEIFSLRHVVPMVGVGVFVYIPSVFGLFLVLLGFGFDPSWALLLKAGFIVGVSSAIGALSFVPNGAGVTEISNAGMLLAFVAPDHPELTPVMAAAIALVQGLFHKWFRVIVGLAVLLIFRDRLLGENFDAAMEDLETYRHSEEKR
ncbi:MAG: flippase-like domain-containing protein [Anaerolineae bacterium]|nr:flippase-like domain-containing protein [Anaerolineae bacterium]